MVCQLLAWALGWQPGYSKEFFLTGWKARQVKCLEEEGEPLLLHVGYEWIGIGVICLGGTSFPLGLATELAVHSCCGPLLQLDSPLSLGPHSVHSSETYRSESWGSGTGCGLGMSLILASLSWILPHPLSSPTTRGALLFLPCVWLKLLDS